MSRVLVLGDVHGAAIALEQVLERAKFDPHTDTLIFLGDAPDGWPDSKRSFDILCEIDRTSDLIYVIGNHDLMFLDWAQGGFAEDVWWKQGGRATTTSYFPDVTTQRVAGLVDRSQIPRAHINLLLNAHLYYEHPHRRLFVHGGFDLHRPLDVQGQDLLWNRSLWEIARDRHANRRKLPLQERFSEVFIGHTATERYSLDPVKCMEVWNLDQGAGWSGRLSLMDIDSLEFWSSDIVADLYPNVYGRK